MSYESARVAVITHVRDQWLAAGQAEADIEFENLDRIDHDTPGRAPFVTFDLHYRDGQQGSIENAPITRYDGEGCFYIHVPEGQGTKPATTRADIIATFMKYKQISNIQFQAPRLLQPKPYKGWKITPLFFSFYYKE